MMQNSPEETFHRFRPYFLRLLDGEEGARVVTPGGWREMRDVQESALRALKWFYEAGKQEDNDVWNDPRFEDIFNNWRSFAFRVDPETGEFVIYRLTGSIDTKAGFISAMTLIKQGVSDEEAASFACVDLETLRHMNRNERAQEDPDQLTANEQASVHLFNMLFNARRKLRL